MGSSRHCPVPVLQGCVSGLLTVAQVKPAEASSLHIPEHPSPSTWLPSSHSSPGSTFASPQRGVHACVTPAALRHVGSCVQVLEQPEPSPRKRPLKRPLGPVAGLATRSPKSHDSPASFLPLPQMDLTQGALTGSQVKPGSTKQVLEQPSPLSALPSSHFSVPVRVPSPHRGTHARPGTRHT